MSTKPAWRKSTHSGTQQGDCVEVADLSGNVGVRDSKNPDGPKLTIDAAAWRTFMRQIKASEHDLI